MSTIKTVGQMTTTSTGVRIIAADAVGVSVGGSVQSARLAWSQLYTAAHQRDAETAAAYQEILTAGLKLYPAGVREMWVGTVPTGYDGIGGCEMYDVYTSDITSGAKTTTIYRRK